MKRKWTFPKFSLRKLRGHKINRQDLARAWARQWERLRLALLKIPSLKVLLIRLPKAKPWLVLIAGLLTADLVTQVLLSTVLLDSARSGSFATRGRRVPVLSPRPTYNTITDRNVFCPGCPVPDTRALVLKRPKDCSKAEPLASGPRLLGTIVLSDPQYSVATIAVGSESKAVKKGEQVAGSGKVFEIRRKRVCFETDLGTLKYIEIPEERTITMGQPLPTAMPASPVEEISQSSTGDIVIKKAFLMSKITDPAVLNSASSSPIYENGSLVGFKVLSINPGSPFEQLVQVGDEIRAINGEPITSIPQIQKLFASVGGLKDLTITINRDGRTFQQPYKVE